MANSLPPNNLTTPTLPSASALDSPPTDNSPQLSPLNLSIKSMPNTIHLSETNNVRRELVSRAEQAGTRALAWNLYHFDRVGVRGTDISVWNNLKADERVGGKKGIFLLKAPQGTHPPPPPPHQNGST